MNSVVYCRFEFSQLKVQINTDLVKHHRQAISNCYFALSIKYIKQF